MNATSRSSRSLLKKRLLILTCALTFGLTLVNSFGLQLIYALFVDGNVHMEAYEPAISGVIAFLTVAVLFFGIGMSVYTAFLFGRSDSRAFFWVMLIQVGISSLCGLAVSLFATTPRLFLLNLGYQLLYLGWNLIRYALLLLGIRTLSLYLRGRATAGGECDIGLDGSFFSLRQPLLKTALLSASIYIAAGLLLAIFDTCLDFYNYGLPVNTEETIYLISPYVELIATFFIGYTVAVGAMYLGEDVSRRGARDREA